MSDLVVDEKVGIKRKAGAEKDDGAEGSSEATIQKIRDIYINHNPTKISELEQLLEKFKGKESELLARVRRKYLTAEALLAASYDGPGEEYEVIGGCIKLVYIGQFHQGKRVEVLKKVSTAAQGPSLASLISKNTVPTLLERVASSAKQESMRETWEHKLLVAIEKDDGAEASKVLRLAGEAGQLYPCDLRHRVCERDGSNDRTVFSIGRALLCICYEFKGSGMDKEERLVNLYPNLKYEQNQTFHDIAELNGKKKLLSVLKFTYPDYKPGQCERCLKPIPDKQDITHEQCIFCEECYTSEHLKDHFEIKICPICKKNF